MDTKLVQDVEALVDKHGMRNVLEAIVTMCMGKAEHVAANWGDMDLARAWERVCRAVTRAQIMAADQGL